MRHGFDLLVKRFLGVMLAARELSPGLKAKKSRPSGPSETFHACLACAASGSLTW